MGHFHFQLSIGAVFGTFAGYYYFSPLILGYKYNEKLAHIHFWLSMVGVLILFVPMHFTGLNGMPRRIPDYPDAFSGWNWVASSGSFIMLASVIVFLYTIYLQLAQAKVTEDSYYNQIDYFPVSWEIPKNYKSLEFVLDYPAKAHSFDVLPLK